MRKSAPGWLQFYSIIGYRTVATHLSSSGTQVRAVWKELPATSHGINLSLQHWYWNQVSPWVSNQWYYHWIFISEMWVRGKICSLKLGWSSFLPLSVWLCLCWGLFVGVYKAQLTPRASLVHRPTFRIASEICLQWRGGFAGMAQIIVTCRQQGSILEDSHHPGGVSHGLSHG